MDKEFDEFLISQVERLYRFAYNRTRNASLADDLTQEILVTAYSAYPKLRDKEKRLPWLWGIARNIYKRFLAGYVELPAGQMQITDLVGFDYETPEETYLQKSEAEQVRRAVSHLSKKYRDVCVLYYLEDKDYNTIAKQLAIPLSSVKWRLNQSREQLRKELETMTEHYRKAVTLYFRWGGYFRYWSHLGAYDNADVILRGRLAQNICIECYEKAKSVQEIASALGVSAEYVEDILEQLTPTGMIRQTANRYQTMFPIGNKDALEDIFEENFRSAQGKAKLVLDQIYGLEKTVREIGFYGSSMPFGKLLPLLISRTCQQLEHTRFDIEKLPFRSVDKAWYALAMTEEERQYHLPGMGGVSYTSPDEEVCEYYYCQPIISDCRGSKKEHEIVRKLYAGELPEENYWLAVLVEQGKVVKEKERFRLAVPVLNAAQKETAALDQALLPVVEAARKLQEQMYSHVKKAVRRHMPPQLTGSVEFFQEYCIGNMLEAVLYDELLRKGISMSRDMVTWYVVQDHCVT